MFNDAEGLAVPIPTLLPLNTKFEDAAKAPPLLYTICVVEPGADTEPESEPVNEVAVTPPDTSSVLDGAPVPIPTLL